jgi:cyclophilin family peptidyl-prolyl cis-trans isomerase
MPATLVAADADPVAEPTSAAAAADSAPAVSAKTGEGAVKSNGAALAEFNQQFTAWKQLLANLRTVQENFQIADRSKQGPLIQQFNDLLVEGHHMAPKLIATAEKAYLENPRDTKLSEFLVLVAIDGLRIDDFETSYRVSKSLVTHGFNDPTIYNVLGISAFAVNEYEDALTYLDLAAAKKAISDKGKEVAQMAKDYEKVWPAEAALRAAEAKADDLPRVKLSTTKGDMVIELFENEAPNTTANFISLVEKGFYDHTPFHRVLQSFMAQGGDPTGKGNGGPGYTIACECYRPDARLHFRGSISMAHAGRDTGGSQFFLNFMPTPHLNGKHTVFGRVIEGTEVLSKLQRVDPDPEKPSREPDQIIKASVVRKRDHAYVPQKNAG